MVNAEVCYAGAVETVLARHPDVAQAFVVGVPDERTGEAVHAFVVPAGGRAPVASALRDLVRAELSANSVPARIHVISEVPMSAGGKPDKAALRERTTDMRRA
jgi:acyl-CoA synthetase (AMP-forming)/AMP-acid ligase II